ncbi:toxin-antitoxin system HicB family antitoxin [Streptomyces mirabilis]|uniref:toxin-antitoxin system HicB family antitoxin n=1 Tax=Streptomyces mirabilis TaxID=68239 RepID=UPI003673E313
MTDPSGGSVPERRPQPQQPQQRKQVLLRLDPLVHEALARWAADELRSANAQIEYLLRRALAEAGRLPGGAGPIPRRGRPSAPATDAAEE